MPSCANFSEKRGDRRPLSACHVEGRKGRRHLGRNGRRDERSALRREHVCNSSSRRRKGRNRVVREPASPAAGLVDLDAPVRESTGPDVRAERQGVHSGSLARQPQRRPCHRRQESCPSKKCWLGSRSSRHSRCRSRSGNRGSAQGYHALTFRLVCSASSSARSMAAALVSSSPREIAAPLGLEFLDRSPRKSEGAPRCAGHREPAARRGAEIPAELKEMFDQFVGPDSLLRRALTLNGCVRPSPTGNTRRRCTRPRSARRTAITNARSLSPHVCRPLWSAPRRARPASLVHRRNRSIAPVSGRPMANDQVLFIETSFGLGYMISSAFSPFGGTGSFGHPGAGGSVGFGDPEQPGPRSAT